MFNTYRSLFSAILGRNLQLGLPEVVPIVLTAHKQHLKDELTENSENNSRFSRQCLRIRPHWGHSVVVGCQAWLTSNGLCHDQIR